MQDEHKNHNHDSHDMKYDKHSERNTFGSRSFIFRWDYYKSGSM